MDREEKIKLANERREAEYAYFVEEFKEYIPQKQEWIVKYMKRVSEISEWSFLWIWEDTPYLERFEKIFKILPSTIRKKVVAKMQEGGDADALYGNESIF